jgi:hypothetical protein
MVERYMHEIDRRHIAALLTGHVGLIETPEGVQPLRMPAGDAHLHDQFSQFAAGMSSGVRLRMITDSIHLRLSVAQRQSYVTRPEEWPSVYDLWIDGKPHRRLSPVGGAYFGMSLAIEGDPAATLEIEDLPAGDKSIELWLPPTALVSIVSLEIDAGAHWKPWPDLQPSVVFHGSSITHGVGLDTATEAWPAIFARDLRTSLLNLGWAGSCLISGLAGRMVRDQAASLIALELGINVHADGLLKERTFLSSVHSFIAIVREGHPTTPIAIVSPIFCEAAEDTALGNGLSLSRMRSLLAEAVETRRGAGDGRIQLISGLDLLGPADAADLPDGLHTGRHGRGVLGISIARSSGKPSPCWASRHRYRCS